MKGQSTSGTKSALSATRRDVTRQNTEDTPEREEKGEPWETTPPGERLRRLLGKLKLTQRLPASWNNTISLRVMLLN